MNNLFKKELYDEIKSTLEHFQEHYQVQILIASLYGSCSLGLSNTFSDVDIHVVLKDSVPVLPPLLPYILGHNQVHLSICYISEMVDKLDEYSNLCKKYPAYIYNTVEERNQNNKRTYHERKERPRAIVYDIMLGDEIWTFAENYGFSYREFHKYLNKADVLDLYYSKVHGNYDYIISKQDTIMVRKYLSILHAVIYSYGIYYLENTPSLNIWVLAKEVDEIIPKIIMERLYYLLEINKNTSEKKEKVRVDRISEIDEFICEFLVSFQEKIRDCDGILFPDREPKYEEN